jgi:hypothetical protein
VHAIIIVAFCLHLSSEATKTMGIVWFKKIAEEYNNILNCYDGRSA